MDLATAIRLVVEDVRQSYPQMSEPAAIEHARDSVGVAELNWDEPNAAAWKLVLETHAGELVLSVAGLVDATIEDSDVWVSTDGAHATIDGMPALEWLDAVFC